MGKPQDDSAYSMVFFKHSKTFPKAGIRVQPGCLTESDQPWYL